MPVPDPTVADPAVADPTAPPSLPSSVIVDTHEEGLTSLTVTGEWEAAALVRAPLASVIARLGLPAVASMLLMTLFYTVDMLWIGRFLGPTALAAATTSVFWIWLIISIAELVSIGLTSLAARRHGERRSDEAARVVGEAIVYSIVLGTLALDQIFASMDVPPEVVAVGKRYLGTYLLGTPLFFGFFAIDAGFRASGDTRTPLGILSVSVLISLVLDPVLILGLGPAPRMGIAGAAVAMSGEGLLDGQFGGCTGAECCASPRSRACAQRRSARSRAWDCRPR